ncbi:conserved hypothetical protein, partial [Hymenobacter roseosalivarius DSM 11622]
PDAVIVNTPQVYYRFHGVPVLYTSPYDEAFLQRVAQEIQAEPTVKEAYIYFNNGIGGAGVLNARQLQKLLNAEPATSGALTS